MSRNVGKELPLLVS